MWTTNGVVNWISISGESIIQMKLNKKLNQISLNYLM